MAFQVIYWFVCSQCKSCRLGVKDSLSAFPENKTVTLQTVELAKGNNLCDTCCSLSVKNTRKACCVGKIINIVSNLQYRGKR